MEIRKIFVSEMNENQFKNYKIMALTITETNGVLLIGGSLNASTAKGLKNHCELLLSSFGEVCLDLKQIAHIDVNGLLTLKGLYRFAKETNTTFSIIGDGSNHKEQLGAFELAA